MPDRLRKSATDKMLFGVCGGLAEYLRIDSTLVRVGFVLLALANAVGLVVYIVLAIVMPGPAEPAAGDREGEGAAGATPAPVSPEEQAERARRLRTTAGAILVLVGIAFLLGNLVPLWWATMAQLWPVLLILGGVLLLLHRFGRS